jgi:serine phosphatase RsbU (regulator of sigma subunit)
VAIGNADARGGRGAARARTDALLELAEALSSAATPAAIGELAVTRAATLLGADAANAFITHPDGLEQVHSAGWAEELTRDYRLIPVQRGRPLSDAVLDATPVWLENAAQWRARYPEMAPLHAAGGFEASACLPLRVADRDLGALVFSFLRPRSVDRDERGFLLAVAALCGQALDRARLLVAERDARAVAEHERDRMTFLAEAGLLLDSPMSVVERLRGLADLVVPVIADWCAVTLVEEDRVDQVAVAHRDPEKVAFVRELQDRYPPDPDTPGGAIRVARTGVASHFAEVTDELLEQVAWDETHLALIRSIGLRSAMTLPLLVRGRSLGSLTLAMAESQRRFGAADVALAEQLAGRAALALDNARLYEQQRTIAHTLQAALLPAVLPEVPGVRMAARYVAQGEGTEVGGDVYDVFADGAPGSWSVVIADVCGKGPTAAALTAMIRFTLRTEAAHGLRPAAALAALNRAMLRHADPRDARFATVAHGRFRREADSVVLSLAVAGHLPPLVVRHDRVDTVRAAGTLLGVFGDPELTEVEVRIGPGESVVLYTDGVTEARAADGALYGGAALAARLAASADRPAADIADDLVAAVLEFQGGRPRDDVAVLVLQAS